jgi:iron complex outermembrane receptor protein
VSLEHEWNENNKLTIKNTVSVFDRTINIPDYVFDGRQLSSYSELAFNSNHERSDWVAGLNFYTDKFKEYPKDAFPRRDYELNTGGAFVQHTWKPVSWLHTEAGMRTDYVTDYGWIWLPRVAALFKISPAFSSRLGGGMGYKTPAIFTEEAERIQYKSVLPVSIETNKLEKSYGANFDVNYKIALSENWKLSVNQLFFFTRINDPLQLTAVAGNQYRLMNVTGGHIDTKGGETNVKLSYKHIKLFVGYTYTDAQLNRDGIKTVNPLTAKHRLNNVLMYEVEDKWKLGLEGYYYSKQMLGDGTTGKPYWILGFMAEKLWERFSLFVNFENFTNTRQTKFGSIYTGTVTNPVFNDIYAPLDGFVVNGGLKLKL